MFSKEKAFQHYINYGIKEGRFPNKDIYDKYNSFDWDFYKSFYSDIRFIDSKNDAFQHYINYGIKERRFPNKDIYDKYNSFDCDFYKSFYSDIRFISSKEEAFQHYINNGIKEGRFPNKNNLIKEYYYFDWKFYCSLYSLKNINNKMDAYNNWKNMKNNIREYNYSKINDNESIITFIIPTIGRKSLLDSINSLYNLKNDKWRAIIIFDGIKNNYDITDKRITCIEIKKNGNIGLNHGNSGIVRNYGLNYDVETEWIGFLDDDDTLSPNYIDYLLEEIEINKNIDICIFRMIDKDKNITPNQYIHGIIENQVGISFAIKKNVADKIRFINSDNEDYLYLKEAEYRLYNIIISPYVAYFIKISPYQCDICDRKYINLLKQEESRQEESSKEESSQEEPIKDESSKEESSKEESSKDESSQEEPIKYESSQDESSQDESSQEESNQDESSQEESSQEEPIKDESSQDESNQDESNKEESSQDESNQDEPIKYESSQDESSQDESIKYESSQEESSQEESNQEESSQDESSQEESNQDEIKQDEANKFSIIMTYYNRREQAIYTLNRFEYLYGNNYNFEIIIVDDNSNDNERLDDIINLYSFTIIYVYIPTNKKTWKNPCIPYNIGFGKASGNIIIIQNPECFHYKNIFDNILKDSLENTYFTCNVMSSPSFKHNDYLINNIDILSEEKIIEYFENENINSPETIKKGWYNHPIYSNRHFHFCSIISKKNLDKLNGFNETFQYNYWYDDDEFLFRIKNFLEIKFLDSFVIHLYHKNGSSEHVKNEEIIKSIEINKNKFDSYKKHSKKYISWLDFENNIDTNNIYYNNNLI